jgi:ubiquinone/menaquinone biosynthesis methyltransferase
MTPSPASSDDPLYSAEFLQALFDEMQGSYERVSNITSLGFNLRWRNQLIKKLPILPGMHIADIMGGGGESWRYLLPRISTTGELTLIDFSAAMCQRALQRQAQFGSYRITVCQEDVFKSPLPDSSMDVVVCVYGVKTLSPRQQAQFVTEVERVLKPGGSIGMVEISITPNPILRPPYIAYLRWVVPIAGKLFLGNPDNYRMLARYTERFQNCRALYDLFTQRGFETTSGSFFFGCATWVIARKS